MPKDTTANKFSTASSSSSPYACNSNDLKFDNELGFQEDVQQWEEIRCPFCSDHPHNAVLLRCSSFEKGCRPSFEKGCRPYACNTSVRQSNCLDQFCKLPTSSPSSMRSQAAPRRWRGASRQQARVHRSELLPKLNCPLCRGVIHGWNVVDAARKVMNSKPRNCSRETCHFVGNYDELRRHARSKHQSVRPSEADPVRQQNWAQLERESAFVELFSMGLGLEYEDQFVDAIRLANEGEEEGEERPDYSFLAYLTRHNYVMRLPAPTTTMNTDYGDDNFRQRNRARSLPLGLP